MFLSPLESRLLFVVNTTSQTERFQFVFADVQLDPTSEMPLMSNPPGKRDGTPQGSKLLSNDSVFLSDSRVRCPFRLFPCHRCFVRYFQRGHSDIRPESIEFPNQSFDSEVNRSKRCMVLETFGRNPKPTHEAYSTNTSLFDISISENLILTSRPDSKHTFPLPNSEQLMP